jgi:uncharacterized protein (TIGR03067 family)
MGRLMRFLLVVVSIAVVPARAQGVAPTGDLARLQGKWATIVTYPNGAKMKVVMEFRGDQVFQTTGDRKDAKPSSQQMVSLDESASPKTIRTFGGKALNVEPDSPLAKIGLPDVLGVYELAGDILKVAAQPFADKPPAKVAPGRGISFLVYVRGETPEPEVIAANTPKPAPNPKAVANPKMAGTSKKQAARSNPNVVVMQGDLAALQGTWSSKEGGFHDQGKETMTIHGDTLVVTARSSRGVQFLFESRIQFDETASPKAIDFHNVRHGSKSGPDLFGIYDLTDQTLTLHVSGPNHKRSIVFETGSEAGRVSTWKRDRSTPAHRGGLDGRSAPRTGRAPQG